MDVISSCDYSFTGCSTGFKDYSCFWLRFQVKRDGP
jgi:hypothetical protein